MPEWGTQPANQYLPRKITAAPSAPHPPAPRPSVDELRPQLAQLSQAPRKA
jgi:hypothetical protein